jgi:MSHA biogenesis protein MshM
MYLKHFGLERSPFKITPDTSLFYEGGNRGAALEAVKYAILQGEGIIKVVGEVGSGKTMLCRMLEVRLPSYVEIVYLANPSLSPEKILHVIAAEMKLPVQQSDDKSKVMQMLQDYLLEVHAKGRQVVVFIEEAQGMPLETLEEIRLLSNLETGQFKMLQMVLFGQPELDENLAKRQIRQLKERISHHFSLDIFDKKDIQSYLNFRLRAAGYKGADLFSTRDAAVIAKYSKGLTRRINILADKTLLATFADNGDKIKTKYIKMAAKDSQYSSVGLPVWLKYGLIVLAIASFMSAGWFIRGFEGEQLGANNSKVIDDKNAASFGNKRIFSGESANLQLKLQRSHLFSERLKAAYALRESASDKQYSIQLIMYEGVLNKSVDEFLVKMERLGVIQQAYIYPAIVNQKDVHQIGFGQFKNFNEAMAALTSLPDELKKAGPFVRSIASIKQEMTDKI